MRIGIEKLPQWKIHALKNATPTTVARHLLQRRVLFYRSRSTLNPFKTAVPSWEQTTQILSILSPRQHCSTKGVKNPARPVTNIPDFSVETYLPAILIVEPGRKNITPICTRFYSIKVEKLKQPLASRDHTSRGSTEKTKIKIRKLCQNYCLACYVPRQIKRGKRQLLTKQNKESTKTPYTEAANLCGVGRTAPVALGVLGLQPDPSASF